MAKQKQQQLILIIIQQPKQQDQLPTVIRIIKQNYQLTYLLCVYTKRVNVYVCVYREAGYNFVIL